MQLGRPTGGIGLQAKIDAMKEVGRKPHAFHAKMKPSH